MASWVQDLGGSFSRHLLADTDYLVVCSEGNQSWAYAAYGRKIEEAMERRKAGKNIAIIHESDFWDALADNGIE